MSYPYTMSPRDEPQETIFCPIRQKNLIYTPEEQVRIGVLYSLLEKGFPESLLVVEKKLSEIIGYSEAKVPNRRVDIVAYRKINHQLLPLLLIECKAHSFPQNTLLQVAGYNYFLKAPFIALANKKSFEMYDVAKSLAKVSHEILSYEILLAY